MLKGERELKNNRQVWGLKPMRRTRTHMADHMKGNMKSCVLDKLSLK